MKVEIKDNLKIIFDDKVQKILDDFASSFSIRITLFSKDIKQLKYAGYTSNCRYCKLLRDKFDTLEECKNLDREKCLESFREKKPIVYICHAGLIETVIPIIIEKTLVGFLMIGQFRSSQTIPNYMKKKYKNDEYKELSEAFLEATYMSDSQINGIVSLLADIVDYIIIDKMIYIQHNMVIENIMKYIKKKIHKNILLEEVASHFGVSAATISRNLKEEYGETFKKIVIEEKLNLAEDYMRSRIDTTVKSAANYVGFQDQYHFSKLYKKFRGYPPKHFKDNLSKLKI